MQRATAALLAIPALLEFSYSFQVDRAFRKVMQPNTLENDVTGRTLSNLCDFLLFFRSGIIYYLVPSSNIDVIWLQRGKRGSFIPVG
jgi:hypothetical protein